MLIFPSIFREHSIRCQDVPLAYSIWRHLSNLLEENLEEYIPQCPSHPFLVVRTTLVPCNTRGASDVNVPRPGTAGAELLRQDSTSIPQSTKYSRPVRTE